MSDVPVAVADIASFARVQSKVEFARLIDELGLPRRRGSSIGNLAAYRG